VDREALSAGLQAVIEAHGPWAWHNVALPFGLFTLGPEPRGDNYRAVKFLQLVADHLQRPLQGLRVIDLGCGEGLYALEFAQHGAEVLGIEGRAANLARAEFARQALGLGNVRFEQGDVRDVRRADLGGFDVVICSGILYHLQHPAAFEFLAATREMCDGLCLIDTRIALTSEVEAQFRGRSYWGSLYQEHAPGRSEAERLADLGASLDNEQSFWFTRHSLANLLADLGYTCVTECLSPTPLMLREDRATFVAIAGQPIRAHNEIGEDLRARRWPDRYPA
jgi:SAM-dependent methyltransferase